MKGFSDMRNLRFTAFAAGLLLLVSCGSTGGNDADVVFDSGSDVLADSPSSDIPPVDVLSADVFDDVAPVEPPDLSMWVNQYVGTTGSGNVFIGATVPHGMVKLGPNTNVGEGSMSGYDYNGEKIIGFAHSHLEGPGGSGNGYNRILVMPVVGAPGTETAEFASLFTHTGEVSRPGYYSVNLDSYGIKAELTASRLVGFHRYTYPASERSAVQIDLRYSLGLWLDSDLTVVGSDTVEGWSRYQTNPLVNMFVEPVDPGTGISKVYFSAKLSRAFDSSEVWGGSYKRGVTLVFPTTDGEQVELRVGISYISVEQARANREEMDGVNFDDAKAEALLQWNRLLSRAEVESDDATVKTRFYTALYHSFLAPADYTEGNGFFSGADGIGQTVAADGWRYYTDDWCIWDTVRTSHPLFTILEPEANSDMSRSLVHTYEAGGWMQKCTWNALGDSRVMTSNLVFCVVADAWLKGYRRFDPEVAWAGMYKGSMQDSVNPMPDGMCGYFNRGTPPEYVENGFVSMDCDIDQSASMTLEHAYNDWCVGKMAEALNKPDDAEFFFARSHNYEKHWNAEAGFMVPRYRDGSWIEDFAPENKPGFCEANSWQYTWFVPHDVCGLMSLMGGSAAMTEKLDRFFGENWFSMDNEPDFHAPWLYNYSGAPSKTQDVVRNLVQQRFSIEPNGLPGNDDAGAMSAWVVFASIGFYPVTPGDSSYQINTPMFPRVTLHIDPARKNGIDFVITAQGLSDTNRYIQSARLNGEPLLTTRLTHRQVMDGGTLDLVMGPQPSNWGVSECDSGSK